MKKFLMAVAALVCMGGVAFAGPNAGGTLIAHDANLAYTTDITVYCGLGLQLGACENADVNLEGSDAANPKVWKVYAAFLPGSSPRLKGMTFGVNYDPSNLIVGAWAPCIGDPNNGAAEFPGAGWPGPNTGTSLVWQFTQTTTLVEAYWFAGYNYYGNPNLFVLQAHPDPILGGNFADDSVPAVQDPIACFGTLGFDMDGVVCCPQESPLGACCIGQDCTITTEAQCAGDWQGPGSVCDPNPCLPPPVFGACCFDLDCVMLTQADCERQGGVYKGDDVPCDPNPCLPPNPTEETSWGQIKANYR